MTPPPCPCGGGSTNDVGAKMSHVEGAGVQRMEWKMTGFLQQCVDLYKEIAGDKGKRLKSADTPFLSISVDNMAKGWALIRKQIATDPPQTAGKYLGCEHIVTATTLEGIPTEDLALLVLPQAADDAPSLSVRGGGDPPTTLGPKRPTSRVRASKEWSGR